jgi:hypothetical protein
MNAMTGSISEGRKSESTSIDAVDAEISEEASYNDDEEWGLNGDEGGEDDDDDDEDDDGQDDEVDENADEAERADAGAMAEPEMDEEAMMNTARPKPVKVLEDEEERHRTHEPLVSCLQRYNSVSHFFHPSVMSGILSSRNPGQLRQCG